MSQHSAFMRLDFALSMMEEGDLEAAIEAAQAAIEVLPNEAQFHFVLGEIYEKAGKVAEAIGAYRTSLNLQEEDRLGAAVRLSMLGAGEEMERLPASYVEALFDDYAPRFENNLVKHLGYCAPQKVFDLIFPYLEKLPTKPSVLDLGCGTGLAGTYMQQFAGYLEGVDLSQEMLKQAAKKQIYDRLEQGDIEVEVSDEARRFDLIVACDVLNYLGDLGSLFQRLRQRLHAGGYLAFSVESVKDDSLQVPFSLHNGQRYVHNRWAVLSWLNGAGFEIVDEKYAAIRTEKNMPVEGHLVLARVVDQSGCQVVPESLIIANDRSLL